MYLNCNQLDGACDTSTFQNTFCSSDIEKIYSEDRCSGHRMCNAAEQAGADYASDSKRNNVLVSEMNDLGISADTSASISEGTSKASADHSNGALIEVDEAAILMSNNSVIKANGVSGDHSYNTSEHFAKEERTLGKGGQEIVEEPVDQTREPSKTCIAMTTSYSEGNGTEKDGTHIPSIHVKSLPKTSGYVCNQNLVESEDDVHPMSAEYRMVETKPVETGTMLENTSSEAKSQLEEVNYFEEKALQETSKELVGDSVTLGGLPGGANGETSIKAVEAWSCASVPGGSQSSANTAEEPSVDSCKGAGKSERRPDMVHTDNTIEVDDLLVLEGLGVGSEGHSTGSCSERDNVMSVNNSDVKLDDAKERVLIDFNESLAWIEIRPHVAEPTAASAKESTNGAVQITKNVEETKIETAMGSLKTQNTLQQPKQMTQDVPVIAERAETSVPTTTISSEEDAAEHVPTRFKEANGETPSETEQEGIIASSDTTTSKSSLPDLAEFFSNARGSKLEEIEEQECAPVMAKVPLKTKLFMESPRSLRMLLFSEETAQSTKKDEKHKKDGKSIEFSSKVVPATESLGNENHTEHSYPAKWYENPDNGEASNVFSGPMAFSGALTYQGVISYSGQISYSGSISHRSDSSASTRSFAFPILASDWNSSPVKMGPPDPRFHRPTRRKWHFCFCCRRRSTLFD